MIIRIEMFQKNVPTQNTFRQILLSELLKLFFKKTFLSKLASVFILVTIFNYAISENDY